MAMLPGLLHRSGAWSDEQLIEAMSDARSDIADGAFERLKDVAPDRPSIAVAMLEGIRAGSCPTRFLERLSDTPAAVFRELREDIDWLVLEGEPEARIGAIRALCAQVPQEEIGGLLSEVLNDPDPRVRDAALYALRGSAS